MCFRDLSMFQLSSLTKLASGTSFECPIRSLSKPGESMPETIAQETTDHLQLFQLLDRRLNQ